MARLGRAYPATRVVKAKIAAGGPLTAFVSDNGSGTDNAAVSAQILPGDTAQATEGAQVIVRPADFVVGTDSQALKVTAATDTATGTDSSLVRPPSAEDTITATDNALLAVQVFGADAATATDTAQVKVRSDDNAIFLEAGSQITAINKVVSDAVSATETATAGSLTPSADTATATDSARVIIRSAADSFTAGDFAGHLENGHVVGRRVHRVPREIRTCKVNAEVRTHKVAKEVRTTRVERDL